jgi:metal-dependent amidase/aminoacylase/carboxypeptidase family protein
MSHQEKIFYYCNQIKNEQIEIRRDLYKNPELSGKEFRTSEIIANKLREYGIDVITDIGGKGVVGILNGDVKGPTIALRADIDALPIQDTLEVSYKSVNNGVKHACGHDVHTTIALGVAKILSKMKGNVLGTVKFIFQPAEETISGAKDMIRAGVLEAPSVEAIFALHVFPVPVGQIVLIKEKVYSACHTYVIKFSVSMDNGSLDKFDIFFQGFLDELNLMNFFNYDDLRDKKIDIIQSINNQPEEFVVIDKKTSKFSMKNKNIFMCMLNIKAACEDTILKTKYSIELVIKKLMEQNNIKVDYSINLKGKMPAVYNDSKLLSQVKESISEVITSDNIIQMEKPIPFFVEDFAYYQEEVPGNLYLLGIKNKEKGIEGNAHHSDFDVDEECIPIGIKVMTNILLNYLENNNNK